MDRIDTPETRSTMLDLDHAVAEPDISMTSLKQQLSELRKQARLHERDSLAACLTLAISLASNKHVS